MTQDALVRGVAERVAAAREAVKSDVDIILELHRKLTPLQAPPVIEAIAQFNPLFVEDPVQIDSIVSQAEVARRVTTPIANGERMHTIWEFRELLVYGGSQYVRPDVGLAGGLTHTRKIAAIAESFHSAVVTHNYPWPGADRGRGASGYVDSEFRGPGVRADRRDQQVVRLRGRAAAPGRLPAAAGDAGAWHPVGRYDRGCPARAAWQSTTP